jgi:hypothetical protein
MPARENVDMKQLLFAVAITSMTFSASVLGADVGVSVSIGEPGFFGRIDVGDAPAPRFINRSPVIGIRGPGEALPPPIYLHVRPGHERNWRRHCREYDACGQPVYFVRDDWYNNTYVPHYRERHRDHADSRDEHRDHRDEHHDGRQDHRDDHEEHRDHREEHR